MKTRGFWLWDDPEGEIYDNLAWDLPGYKQRGARRSKRKSTAKLSTAPSKTAVKHTR